MFGDQRFEIGKYREILIASGVEVGNRAHRMDRRSPSVPMKGFDERLDLRFEKIPEGSDILRPSINNESRIHVDRFFPEYRRVPAVSRIELIVGRALAF